MIAFTCPKCNNKLQRADNEAGQKTTCPACGQRLQIPHPLSIEEELMVGEIEVRPRRSYRQEPQEPQQSWLGFAAVVFAVLCLLGCIGYFNGSSGVRETRKLIGRLTPEGPDFRFWLEDLKRADDTRMYILFAGIVFGLFAIVSASAVFMQVNKSKGLSLVAYGLCLVGLLIVIVSDTRPLPP